MNFVEWLLDLSYISEALHNSLRHVSLIWNIFDIPCIVNEVHGKK
jgi:hypothetical protein